MMPQTNTYDGYEGEWTIYPSRLTRHKPKKVKKEELKMNGILIYL